MARRYWAVHFKVLSSNVVVGSGLAVIVVGLELVRHLVTVVDRNVGGDIRRKSAIRTLRVKALHSPPESSACPATCRQRGTLFQERRSRIVRSRRCAGSY